MRHTYIIAKRDEERDPERTFESAGRALGQKEAACVAIRAPPCAIKMTASLLWLGLGLGLVLVLGAALSLACPVAWEHAYCFLAPFVQDNALTCPTSEAVADRLLRSPALRPNPWEGKIAIVTGCTLGGIGAQTAEILAGKVGACRRDGVARLRAVSVRH